MLRTSPRPAIAAPLSTRLRLTSLPPPPPGTRRPTSMGTHTWSSCTRSNLAVNSFTAASPSVRTFSTIGETWWRQHTVSPTGGGAARPSGDASSRVLSGRPFRGLTQSCSTSSQLPAVLPRETAALHCTIGPHALARQAGPPGITRPGGPGPDLLRPLPSAAHLWRGRTHMCRGLSCTPVPPQPPLAWAVVHHLVQGRAPLPAS